MKKLLVSVITLLVNGCFGDFSDDQVVSTENTQELGTLEQALSVPAFYGIVKGGTNNGRRCVHSPKNYANEHCQIPAFLCPTIVEIDYAGLGTPFERQATYDGYFIAINQAFPNFCFLEQFGQIPNENIRIRFVSGAYPVGRFGETIFSQCNYPASGVPLHGRIYKCSYALINIDILRINQFANSQGMNNAQRAEWFKHLVVHELGHSFGLGHNDVHADGVNSSTMYSGQSVFNAFNVTYTNTEFNMLQSYVP
jgi:hypothetical protein